MSTKVLTKRDIDDFLAGAEILGTGGGGGIAWARGMLEYIDEYDKKISLIDPTDVPEEALVVGAAGVGGGVTPDVREKIEKKFGARPSMKDFMKTGILAEKMLSGYLGENIYASSPRRCCLATLGRTYTLTWHSSWAVGTRYSQPA